VSVDGLVDLDGVWECKTMVSSDTLFRAVVDGDISDYTDQCYGAMWLLHRQWVDLCLWAPDLPGGARLHVVRIQREEAAIERLVDDLVAFERLVTQYEAKLRGLLSATASVPPWVTADASEPTPRPEWRDSLNAAADRILSTGEVA